MENSKPTYTICVASWKSAVCHKRNKDRLDKLSRGFQIETPSLSHVSGWSWNATPFWQLKIQPRNGVHSVDALVLYGNTIYSVRGILQSQTESHRSRCFSQLFEIFHSDQIVAHFWYASYWWRIDKEEGIRWRSYHLDQLQSWKSSQVRLVKISVGVIMLTERFCPVLMLRPFKKHSANTTTQKIK